MIIVHGQYSMKVSVYQHNQIIHVHIMRYAMMRAFAQAQASVHVVNLAPGN